MSEQTSSGASDATEQTEPESQAVEQPTDYADHLLALAREDGHTIGNEPPKDEAEVAEPETLESEVPATEPEEPEPSDEAEPKPEEEKPEAKGDEWPQSAKARVAEETAKRKRANERAEKAEDLIAQYQAQLSQAIAPRPTEDDPFRDVIDMGKLESLERSYEKAIDLADENPDGAVDVVVGRNPDGSEKRLDFSPEQLGVMRKKADKALRKFIPERKTYLQQRAVADAQAAEIYPELKDPNSEFTQAAATLAQSLMNGYAMKAPDALVWIARAVRGYQMELQRNGKETVPAKSPEAKRIVESARQKIAPTPTRTRSFVERGTRSVNLEKAEKNFEQRGDAESAEDYVGALLSKNRGGPKKVESYGE